MIYMNLSNYFFRTDSIVLISITRSLLALYFMHESFTGPTETQGRRQVKNVGWTRMASARSASL